MSGKTDVWMRNCEKREASLPTPLFLCGVSSVYVTDTSPQSSFYLVKHLYRNRTWVSAGRGEYRACRVTVTPKIPGP